MREGPDHEFEAKIKWRGEKSWLIETTIPLYEGHYLYFLPNKCRVDYEETGDGNFMFTASDWWYSKVQRGDFQAEDR